MDHGCSEGTEDQFTTYTCEEALDRDVHMIHSELNRKIPH